MQNKFRFIVACIGILLVVSCGNRQKQTQKVFTTHVVEVKDSTRSLEVWEQPISNDTIMLSQQVLTSPEKMEEAFDNGVEGDFLHESTPATAAFFKREKDIKSTQLAIDVQRRYNYAATIARVIHAYEWFERVSSDVLIDEDSLKITRKDTLAWIKESQPKLDYGFLRKALNLALSEEALIPMLEAYRRYDGSTSEDSEFAKAFKNCQEKFAGIVDIVSESQIDKFEAEFWPWYDKAQFVPGIDNLIIMHTQGYKGEKISEEQLPQFINAVKRERDIDRRTILALELVKFDSDSGIPLLGDILESGIYTRYLLESWISWRANLQSYYSPSSFSVIPNNYYDMLRVKCLNTFLRHLQEEPNDYKAKVLMENMILCEIMHRMGSIAGNESFKTRMLLDYSYFIPKRLRPEDDK